MNTRQNANSLQFLLMCTNSHGVAMTVSNKRTESAHRACIHGSVCAMVTRSGGADHRRAGEGHDSRCVRRTNSPTTPRGRYQGRSRTEQNTQNRTEQNRTNNATMFFTYEIRTSVGCYCLFRYQWCFGKTLKIFSCKRRSKPSGSDRTSLTNQEPRTKSL